MLAPMRWLLCGLVALVGCDEVFDLEDVTLADAAIDVAGPVCPTSYSLVLEGSASRYRVIAQDESARVHHLDCMNDSTDMTTHLVVLDTSEELLAVQSSLETSGMDTWWVGVVQPREQGSPGEGWVWLTGEPVAASSWDGGEPNDGDGTENNQENFSRIAPGRTGMADTATGNSFGALCECDGRPVDATVNEIFDSNG